LIILGSVTPAIEAFRHIKNIYYTKSINQRSDYADIPELYDLFNATDRKILGPSELYLQYLGSFESPFFTYIAKKQKGTHDISLSKEIKSEAH
jgi:hypothetical protein